MQVAQVNRAVQDTRNLQVTGPAAKAQRVVESILGASEAQEAGQAPATRQESLAAQLLEEGRETNHQRPMCQE